jgi:hypothetical protein
VNSLFFPYLPIGNPQEAEDWWNKGWIFVDATTDTLMENVVLQFERDI